MDKCPLCKSKIVVREIIQKKGRGKIKNTTILEIGECEKCSFQTWQIEEKKDEQ